MMRAAAAIELAGRAAERRIFGDAADDFLAVNVGFASESGRRRTLRKVGLVPNSRHRVGLAVSG